VDADGVLPDGPRRRGADARRVDDLVGVVRVGAVVPRALEDLRAVVIEAAGQRVDGRARGVAAGGHRALGVEPVLRARLVDRRLDLVERPETGVVARDRDLVEIALAATRHVALATAACHDGDARERPSSAENPPRTSTLEHRLPPKPSAGTV